MRDFSENSEHAVLGMINDLDDTSAMTNSVLVFDVLDAQQHAVADPGSFTGPRLARQVNTDFRCRAMRVLVPFVRGGNEIAIAVTRRDISKHGRGEGAGMVQLLAALFD